MLATVPSRIVTAAGPATGRKRDPSTPLRAGGMTEGKGKEDPRTGPAERDRLLYKKESQV